MKWRPTILAGMVLLGVGSLFFFNGCTSMSTRADLHVDSVNGNATYYSDLINTADTSKPFIPIDQVKVTFSSQPHDGSAPVQPGKPFSDIVVTSYTVTYNNSVYSPISGGMNVVVPSGSAVDAFVTISNPSEKAALLGTLTSTVTSTAKLDFQGYLRTTGNFGDKVSATAYLTVQVDNFADK